MAAVRLGSGTGTLRTGKFTRIKYEQKVIKGVLKMRASGSACTRLLLITLRKVF